MELREITDGVWTFEFGVRPGPGVHFPTRSTILRLDDGTVAIISPGPFDEEAADQIRQLADQVLLIAPNMVHHLYLKQALAIFPGARVYGPRKLGVKVKSLEGLYQPLDEAEKRLSDAVEIVYLKGNSFLGETVFFHRSSRTLVVTDFVFHMRRPFPWADWLGVKNCGLLQ